MKKSLTLLITGALVQAAAAQAPFTDIAMWSGNVVIPDNDPNGLVTQGVVTLPFDQIGTLTVTLEFDGGWNGDLYAYLTYDGEIAVLLNRIGRTDTTPGGQGGPSGGMLVTFADSAAEDVHLAVSGDSTGYVTGIYQPDARESDPAVVTTAAPRTAFLDAFANHNPNGQWTLFVADLGAGETSHLLSWSLGVQPVPEPSAAMLGAAGAFVLLSRRGKRRPVSFREYPVTDSSASLSRNFPVANRGKWWFLR